MKKKCLFPFLLILSITLSGCGQKAQDSPLERTGTDGNGAGVMLESQEELVPEMEGGIAKTSETEGSSASGNISEDMGKGTPTTSDVEGQNGRTDTPVVYMTRDISSDGLMKIYQALSASPSGKIAVKLSTGEPGSNYLRTDLIGNLVQSLEGTIVECNTAYGGSRANTAMHYQVAEDHSISGICNDILFFERTGSEFYIFLIGG